MPEAILYLNEAEDILQYKYCPATADKSDWSLVQRRSRAYLHLYIRGDVYSLIEDNMEVGQVQHAR